jgi:hypothetical protein
VVAETALKRLVIHQIYQDGHQLDIKLCLMSPLFSRL